MQAVIDQRGGMRGRPPKKHFNIWRSLLKDARNGGAIGVNYSRWEGGQKRVLANSDRVAGLPQRTFPADIFDAAVLKLLREVDPREVIGESAAAEQVLTLTGEREQLAARIQRTLDALGNSDSPAIVARVTAWEAQLRDIDRQLTEARQQAANPLAASWGELPSLIEAASTEDGRIRLSAILRRILTQVWCLFIPRGRVRCAVVQMFFREGQTRSYVVAYSQAAPAGSGKGRKMHPERWGVRSLLEVGGPRKVDLRDPASVANIETTFAVLPLHTLLTAEATTPKGKK